MQHYKSPYIGGICTANKLFLSGQGLQCGNCLDIDFFDNLTAPQKKAYIEDIEKAYRIKLDPKTGKQI